ncbi:MAG: hypothetical protein PHF24_06665 [Syntrophomonas sp.]|nr:hypothetical protein [Syntrophomonas sp.]
MVRDWRILLFPLFIVFLFMAVFFIFQSKQPDPKPVPEADDIHAENADPAQTEPKWYVQFSVSGQKATYYTEAPQAPASASSHGYFLGSGAVHPLYPINDGGDALKPIIPFGTVLYLSAPVEIQGNNYNSLVVNDTGDVYYGLWRNYPYWVDIYAGQANYYTNKEAYKSGVKLVDYYWYQPWI